MDDPALPEIPPAAFAVTMATGILAVAAREHHLAPLGAILTGVAAGAYCTLALAWLANARRRPDAVAAELRRPAGALGLLTFVAASSVLASAWSPLALDRVLAAIAAASWAALLVPAVLALRRSGRGGARGGWLMLTVATESVVIAAIRAWPAALPGAVVWIAAALWAVGLLAYAYLAPPVTRSLAQALRARAAPRGDEWILMGALAIGALASAELAALAEPGAGWSAARSVLDVGTGVCWLGATIWLAPLLATELRSAALVGTWRYRFERWSTVFPLGMYAVASHAVGLRLGLPGLDDPAVLFLVAGLIVWSAAVAGLGHRALRWTGQRR